MNALTASASIWNFAGSEPEFAACSSRLFMLNGDPARTARCSVLHDETGETAHSALVNGVRAFWSDEDATVSLAWLELLPQCAHCQARHRESAWGAYCNSRCAFADKHSPVDDYEAEAAA